MTRSVAVALAVIVLAGSTAVAFALGAASTRIPPTVLVDTPDSLRPSVVQSEQKGKPTATSVPGSVRTRTDGGCMTTGPVEAARQHYVNDPACAATP